MSRCQPRKGISRRPVRRFSSVRRVPGLSFRINQRTAGKELFLEEEIRMTARSRPLGPTPPIFF